MDTYTTAGFQQAYDAHHTPTADDVAQHECAFAEALAMATRIIKDADLLAEAVMESQSALESTAALCTLLSSADLDARRKAREVLAAAIVSMAVYSIAINSSALLNATDKADIAARVIEALP